MLKLLYAGIYRYCKSAVWWTCVASSVILGVICALSDIGVHSSGVSPSPMFLLQLVFACLAALLVGREVSDHLIRNKLIAGHGKGKVLLSELILNVLASAILLILFLLTIALLNHGALSAVPMNVKATMLLGVILLNVVCVVINVLVSVFIHHCAVSAIVCLLLVCGMCLGAGELSTALNQQEFITETELAYQENGLYEVVHTQVRNPNYVGGARRKMYQLLLNVLPYGHCIEYANVVSDYMQREDPFEKGVEIGDNAYYAAGTVLILSVAGIFLFKRKELK